MDEQLRKLGREARAEVENTVDVDAAWSDAQRAEIGPSARLTSPDEAVGSMRIWLAAAALITVVVVGWIAIRDGDDSVVTVTPATVADPPTTRLPAVDIPAATVPAAENPATTEVPASTTPPTTAGSEPVETPPATTILPVAVLPGNPADWRSFRAEASGIRSSCDEEKGCTQVRSWADGTAVTYDPTTRVLTSHVTPPISAVMPDTYGDVFIEFLGPDNVAYLNVDPTVEGEFAADLVAIALGANDAGHEIMRWAGGADVVGDSDFVPTPDGVVRIGCCGPDPVRPAEDAEVDIAWVGRDGQPIRAPQMSLRAELGYPTAAITRVGAVRATEQTWEFELSDFWTPRGTPPSIPTFDNGFITTFPGQSGDIVVRGWPDGVVQIVELTSRVDAVEPSGAVLIADDGWLRRVELFEDRSEYWGGQRAFNDDGTIDFGDLNAEVAADPKAWAFDPVAFVHAVAGRIQVNESRSIVATQSSEFGWAVTVTTGNFFDDSVAASRFDLELARSDVNGSFSVIVGRRSNACQPGRGHSEFSTELCV